MSDLYNSLCISSLKASVLELMGMKLPENNENPNPLIKALAKKKLGDKKIDRAVIYNPDAVALWLYQKYTHLFAEAAVNSDLAVPMLSVMPSVTPVCFASMYTGVMPDVHGIKKYVKPVLKVDTLFDRFAEENKKAAIVSTSGDSISTIFLERDMDYFIFDTVEEVNKKAFELIEEDNYDLIVIYNGDYDGTMHKNGTEADVSIEVLKQNLATYNKIIDKINAQWKDHNVLYGFCPDHGCHDIDGGCGSHGLDMEEDMNVIHFYGIKEAE